MDSFSLQTRAARVKNSYEVGCHAWNPNVKNAFGYQPSLAAGIIFVILFASITLTLAAQVAISRKWWYLVFVAGAVGKSSISLLHLTIWRNPRNTPTDK